MSIAALYELQERLHNSAIAGVHMIGEDFRLHRAIEQWSQASAASPIFQKIALQLQPLTEPETPHKAAVLMDALALIDAVLYTQGTTQVQGELEAISVIESSYQPCRYSDLQPLKQALSEKGAGRYEIVRSAHEAGSPALRDYRLKSYLVAALADSYAEMAELVKTILLSENEMIIPFLKQNFDPQGKRDMARRLEIIEQIEKERENAYYLSLLEGSSSVVKEAAIRALKHDESNTDVLIHLAETEKGAVKTAAYSSLSNMSNKRAEALWLKHLKKKAADVEGYLDEYLSDDISDVIAEKLGELIFPLLDEKRYDLEANELEQLQTLVRMTVNKSSSGLNALLNRLAEYHKELGKLRNKQTAKPLMLGRAERTLLEELNLKLIYGLVSGLNEELQPMVERVYREHPQEFLHAGFAAALVSKPAQAVYDEFAPLLQDKQSADIILACLSQILYDDSRKQYVLSVDAYSRGQYWQFQTGMPLYEPLYDRWIEQLTDPKPFKSGKFKRLGQLNPYVDSIYTSDKTMERYDAMLMRLINPDHAYTSSLLYRYFEQASQALYTDIHLYALYQLGHREFHDLIVQLVQKSNCATYQLKRICEALQLSREQEIQLIEGILQRIEQGKWSNRYLTKQRVTVLLDQMNTGDEVSYW